jgi:glucosamine-6-phosphate deaminase
MALMPGQDEKDAMKPLRSTTYDKMPVSVYASNAALGEAAAVDLAAIMRQAVSEHGETSIIVATGNSQLSFMKALRSLPDIPWDRITVFHMDEYLGIPDHHPAGFRLYIREKLTDIVRPRAFYGIQGDAPDIEKEMARYAELLETHRPVACVLGIGENGHLAFNDPPADFHIDKAIHVVRLAETARQQQVGEGHFATVDDVPEQAITLTIPALLRPAHVLAVVPERRKAPAVRAALLGPVSEECPASILRTLDHTKLYLDPDSASLL